MNKEVKNARSSFNRAMRNNPEGVQASQDNIVRQILKGNTPSWGSMTIRGIRID